MRLSEVLDLAEIKKREIVLIGTWKTGQKEYAVLAHQSQKIFPVPKLFHLVEIGPEDCDPEIDPAEVRSILARFGYFEAISKLHSE